MKRNFPKNTILARAALIVAIGLAMNTAGAALTDIASSPLSKSGASIVKPNLMFLLDSSGSMDWDFMPDALGGGVAPNDENLCKSTGTTLDKCTDKSDPARTAALSNGIYYDPSVTYTPAVKFDGTNYPSYNNGSAVAPITLWTAVKNDAYGIQFTGTTDLTVNFPDTVWCNTNSPSTSDRSPPFSGQCKQPIQGGVWTYPNSTYNQRFTVAGTNPPYYYTLSSLTWCSSRNTGIGGFGSGTCQAKKTATYQYPKYGPAGNNGFTRTQIVPATTTYPRAAGRTDCAAASTCTYAEEMTNFANWYAYYRTRLQMMKTATGLAFKSVTDTFRVGMITISPGSPVAASHFLPIADFTAGAGGQKDLWYTKFYAQDPGSSTPLREGLSRVGRYYAHVTSGINNGMSDDPVQYSCQKNFTIMSTDGYWNGNAGQQLDGSAIGHQDSDPVAAPRPMLDGPLKTTTTTTNDTYTQQVCSGGAANSAFGATNCGCATNFKRVKQQKSSAITTVVTIDGVFQSSTPSSATVYSDITACNAVVTTAVTPTTMTDQQTVQGNAATTFATVNGISAGRNTNGTCGANFAQLITRTTNATSTVVTTGGSAAAPVLGATYSFSYGSCVALTNTVVTRITVVQQQTLTANAASTFGGISDSGSGPVIGATAGTQATGTCAANRAQLWQRTSTYDRTVITVGSTVGSPTFGSVTYNAPVTVGSCTDLTTKTTVTETAQNVCTGSANTTYSAALNGLNSQSACGCSGGQTALKQRVWTYVKTVVGTGSPTYSTTTPTHSVVTACSNTAKVAASTVVNNVPLSVTGAPVAAATTNSSSVISNTTNASAAPTPGPSTSVTGATTSTSVGATITSADFTISPNPTTTNNVSSVSVAVGYADTLADVAQYYYYTDLRAPGSLGAAVAGVQSDVGTLNDVPTQPNTDNQNDLANWQHMNTFTVGLGVDGTLTFDPGYRDKATGDFLAIKNGSLNWPQPVADTQTAVDDLWHTAVNGRGRYFSARDPSSLVDGLTKALISIKASFGSSSAAATSNLKPVQGDNFYAYVANYQTGFWDGDLEARTVDPDTGVVSALPALGGTLKAQPKLDVLAAATVPGGNNRKIVHYDSTAPNKLEDFTWANLSATEKTYFSAPWIGTGTAPLSQWSGLNATDQGNAAGANLVNFLRGDQTNNLTYYRDRSHVLGDIVDGAPVYVKAAQASFVDAGYSSPAGANFMDCVNTGGTGCGAIFSGPRAPTVYVAANDGMLHAFDGATLDERWAYVPNMLLPQLYHLADKNYVHQFYADGSPSVADVYDPAAAKWKTILVAGLNSGGRGYYALDVTDPATPIGLWEFTVRPAGSCPSSTLLGTDKDDCDLGLTFGNPIMTKLASGTWVVVVTSGYNNVSPGDGKGYVYVLDPMTGVILKKIQAANASQAIGAQSLAPGNASTGSTTTPLGLAKINAWVDDGEVDNTTLRIYGGDLQGHLWRFNLDTGTAYAVGYVTDSSGVAQPVTTKVEMADVSGVSMVYVGTGRYLGNTDVATSPPQQQSVYGIKDATSGVAPAAPIDARGGTMVVQTLTNSPSVVGVRTLTGNAVDLTTKNGFRIDFPDSGERVNIDMQLILGTLIVSTNVPTPSVCEPSGYSWSNYLDYKTGGAVIAGGYSGVRGNGLIVGFTPVETSDDRIVGILIKDDNTIDTSAPQINTPSATGRRSSWRELH